MKSIILAGLIALSGTLYAQNSIPIGTIVPVQTDFSLSKKTKSGERIAARVMQDVPLGNGTKIPQGSRLIGEVIAVPAPGASSASVSFRFDRLVIRHRSTPVKTDLRALASPLDIDDAQLPEYGGDRGTPSTAYTTTQIGGDQTVYRGGGHVENNSGIVGEPVEDGILGPARPNGDGDCRGPVGGNGRPQAFWLFATDACGIYGYNGVKILNAGRDKPAGEITLASERGELNIRSGSGMLLRVIGSD